MTRKLRLDELAINRKGGARTNHIYRCDSGSFLVMYRTHLYEKRQYTFMRKHDKIYKGGQIWER